ncbi:MAG: ABC transporter permease, partial [Chloroflexota bacterium]
MARFLIRSVISTIVTMLIVSAVLFILLEVSGRDVTRQILGVFSTPEQRESLRNQLGYNQSAWIRYSDWLIGNDWRLRSEIGNFETTLNSESGEIEWWIELDDGRLVRHRLDDNGELLYVVRQADDSTLTEPAGEDVWNIDPETGEEYFWGITGDAYIDNSAARWVRGSGQTAFVATQTGVQERTGAPTDYIPLRKGLLRGDAGVSLKFARPVSATLPGRIWNTAILAGTAFVIVMPLALVLGIITGINEGKFIDRFISVTSLA